MAIDTKNHRHQKIVKDAQDFKKVLAESEKLTRDVVGIYAGSLKVFGDMAKIAGEVLTRIADGKTEMNTKLGDLKNLTEMAKSVKSDVEMALRREAEGSA